MDKLSTTLEKKMNRMAWVFMGNGIFLLILAILIVWIPFMIQLLLGMIAVIIGFVFMYSAYKLWHFRSIIGKYVKF